MTRALADQSRAYLAAHDATTDPAPPVTAAEWLAAERAARIEDDPHREISDTDLTEPTETACDPRPSHREHPPTHTVDRAPPDDRQETAAAEAMTRPAGRSDADHHADEAITRVDAAEQEDHDAAGHSQRGLDAFEGSAPAIGEHGQENDLEATGPTGPTGPDARDVAGGKSRPHNGDVVRVPEPDETATELARARRALAEITDRRHREHQHDQHERDDQLARWHTDDRDPATTTCTEQTAHDADQTSQQ